MKQTYLGATLLLIGALACNNSSTPSQPLGNTPTDGGTICIPATCSTLQRNCGSASDGCGGTLNCGTCPSGQTCGQANVCIDTGVVDGGNPGGGGGGGGGLDGGITGEEGGSTKWVHTFPQDLTRIDADARGDIIVTNRTRLLHKYNSDGESVWAFDDPDTSFTGVFSVKSTGTFYAWGFRDIMGSPQVVIRYSADTSGRTVLDVACDTCPRAPVAADEAGNWAVIDRFNRTFTFHRTDGTTWSLSDTEQAVDFIDVAFDPNGNAIIGGQVVGRAAWNGRWIGDVSTMTPLVFKYDNAGHMLWLVDVPGLYGGIMSVGTSAIGTVVAAGLFERTAMFGSDVLSYSPANFDFAVMLLVIEADGSPRWAKQFDGGQHLPPMIAVDPPGQVAIAYRIPACHGTTVKKLNLAGADLWTRQFKPKDCNGKVDAAGITLSKHNVVLSGAMSGIVDFGRGEVPDAAGFLLELAP